MKLLRILVLPMLLGMLSGGCDEKGLSMKSARSMFAKQEESERGRAHLNPYPTAGYQIRLKVDDAPGPFQVVRLGGQFDVRNEHECGRIHPKTGTPARVTSMESVDIRRISETEYEGVIYLDMMLDEDYYGRGVCHWELTSAYANFVVSDERGVQNFQIGLDAREVVVGGVATMYYPHRAYEERGTRVGTHVGSAAPEDYVPDIRAALFSLTLSSTGEVK